MGGGGGGGGGGEPVCRPLYYDLCSEARVNMAVGTMSLFALASVFIVADVGSCAKIALFPMGGGSQYLVMKSLAEELADRGHEVF